MDAQRAMSVGSRQGERAGHRSAKIGMLGFSAGGISRLQLGLRYEQRQYDSSTRPTMCLHGPILAAHLPAYMVDGSSNLKPEYQPTKVSPPMFLALALDDRVTVDSSIAMTRALKAAGVPAEIARL